MAIEFADFLNVEKDYIDVSEDIFSYAEDAYFLRILTKLNTDPADSPKIYWKDYDIPSLYTLVSGTYTASDTDIELQSVAGIYAGTVLINTATGEHMRVTAVNRSTNHVTVTRGVAGTTAQAINNGDNIYILGVAEAESGSGPEVTVSKGEAYNYAQIWKHEYPITHTVEATKFRLNALKQDLNELFFKHRVEIENAMFWGQRDYSNSIYYNGGINYWVPGDNVGTVATGNFNRDWFDQFLIEKGFAYGSNTKYMFAGNTAFRYVYNLYVAGERNLTTDERVGLKVVQILAPHGGVLHVIRHPLFKGDYEKVAFIVDMDNVTYRPLIKSGMFKLPDTGSGITWQLRTQASLEVRGPYTHAKIVLT